MKDKLIIIFIIVLGLTMYGLTLNGAIGNPTPSQIKGNLDQPTQAFELSPERGRYVEVANLAERGVYNLTPQWADIAYPDVGMSKDGRLYSYFAPGVPYLSLPFYLVGYHYNLAQVATFSAEIFMSIITLVFIYLIGIKVFKLPRNLSIFSVLAFAFASVSLGYSTTLYQHAFSTCFMVTAFYAVWRYSQSNTRYCWLYASYVWLAYALAIFVDYPNAVLMLPVMVYLALSTFPVQKISDGFKVSIRWVGILTFIVFALVIGLQFWHNATYYGGWNHLAGELQSYKANVATTTSETVSSEDKTALGFFHEKDMPNGFFILLFSSERGLFFFSPIFLFALLGIWYFIKKKEHFDPALLVPISLIVVDLFLYSSWGDPWGGWAYGPRYLIPSMPWLALFVGVALYHNSRIWKKLLAYLLFLYSLAIALIGALTSNAVPPKSEALLLPSKTYNFLHDIPFLLNSQSNSFLYKVYFTNWLTLLGYLVFIYLILAIIAFVTLFLFKNKQDE